MNNLIEILDLKNNTRIKILILSLAFSTGVIIPNIPYLVKTISNQRAKRIIEINNKNLIIKIEQDCKSQNSKYKKFLNLGFKRFAIEEFNKCMKEKLKKETF